MNLSMEHCYWAKKELNQHAECLQKRNWMKSVLGLDILIGNPPGTLQMRPAFNVSSW